MKHVKKITNVLPAQASAKGQVKSCGPVKDFFGACQDTPSKSL